MEWIAGDIGGTKSWLAWVGGEGHPPRFEKCYASAGFGSAEALIEQFIRDAGQAAPGGILLALPGALAGQRTRLTNLDWSVDADTLQAGLGVGRVRVINDFQAAAAGVATLTDADVVALNAVTPDPHGVRAITGAGTGLGLAFMLADAGGNHQGFATEGGHIDFAPANAMQDRLLVHLRKKYGHVSWERVASGSAMHDLYRFCCIEHGQPLPDSVTRIPLDGAAVDALAAAGDVAAQAALDLFIDVYGAWVGNVALLYQPYGGLFIAGGVATHMAERMRSPRFMAAAVDKGRMSGVVERTPIFLVTQPRLGLAGAIRLALGDTRH